ncbi:MAG: DUF932 domain-containing protein [Synechococcus sp.]|nr:DUF932 domain-containing protein [Synechococcus sp.]
MPLLETAQLSHHDTAEARSVSRMDGQGRHVTSGYSRERHLLLTAPKQVALHAGGIPVGPDATPRDAFRAAGADFAVEPRPIAFDRAFGTDEFDFRVISSHKAIVRTDTNRSLGVVGQHYSPVQNEALIQLFEYLREDAQIDNIITLRSGAKIVVTASVAIEGEVKPGDPVRRYLHAFNSHDGTSSFGVFFSDMRMVCANQIAFITGRGARRAHKDGAGLVMRHTRGVQDFAQRLPELINLQNRSFEHDLAQLQPLTTTRLTTEAARAILEATYADKLASPITDKATGKKRDRTFEDLKTERDTIRSHYQGSTGIGIDTSDRSVWNLFQAITQYETHDAGRAKDETERARLRLESLWGGAAADRIARAREACLALV